VIDELWTLRIIQTVKSNAVRIFEISNRIVTSVFDSIRNEYNDMSVRATLKITPTQKKDYGGKDIWKKWVLNLEWKVEGVKTVGAKRRWRLWWGCVQDEVNQEESEQNEGDRLVIRSIFTRPSTVNFNRPSAGNSSNSSSSSSNPKSGFFCWFSDIIDFTYWQLQLTNNNEYLQTNDDVMQDMTNCRIGRMDPHRIIIGPHRPRF